MATSSTTASKAAPAQQEQLKVGIRKSADPHTGNNSKHDAGSVKMSAVYLNPSCEHDWFKLANDLQTLASEGKTIWQCRTCAEITNTYEWQTPKG